MVLTYRSSFMGSPLVAPWRLTLPAATRRRSDHLNTPHSAADIYCAQIAALVLENTFTSLPNLVPDVLPMLGRVSFMCHQKWDSASKAPKLPAKMPVLLLSGKDDLLIPPLHMHKLRDLFHARGEDNVTYFEEFPGGGHSAYFSLPLSNAASSSARCTDAFLR